MNNFLNIFSSAHKLFAYRWLILTIIGGAAIMSYFDYTNDGFFMDNSKSQQWSSGGPGYHK
jgi:hypothetical protein